MRKTSHHPARRCSLVLLLPLLILLLRQRGVLSLKLLRIQVPPYKVIHDSASLTCEYELQGDETLYSVKWYKGTEEFYRYLPTANPSFTSYKVEGIRVELQQSDSKRVHLTEVNFNSTGVYRCEVSLEAPAFQSVKAEGCMEVIYYNRKNPSPTITGGEQAYEVGDTTNLNCTSSPSFPAADLKWHINGNQVMDARVIKKYKPLVMEQGYIRSRSSLHLEVAPHHVVAGYITVRCTATISINWTLFSKCPTMSPLAQHGSWEKELFVRGGASNVNPSASIVTALVLTSLTLLQRTELSLLILA